MNITLRQLQAFIAVARSGSFSRTAQALHVTQPALTLMIQKLERQLDTQLFERHTRAVHLSPSGRELLPAIQRLIGELESTLDGLRDTSQAYGGTVTLGCIPSAGALLVPELIRRFAVLHPRARIVVKDAMTETRGMIGMLRKGEIDIAVGPRAEEGEFDFEPCARDRMAVLLAASHRLARRKRLAWREIADEPIVSTSYHSQVRHMMDEAFSANGLSVRPSVEVALVATAVGMARAGLGAAVLPEDAARMCNLAGVSVVPLTQPVQERVVGLTYRSFSLLSAAGQAFVRLARERNASA